MSAADLRAGYAIAGGGQANVIDLTTAASKVVTHQLEQDELTRTRQEAFDKARADFKKDMSDTYDTYVYEDNFDDTGILNLDQAGEKLRGSIKSQYLQTEYEYSQGLIDEAEVRRRNNNLKGQVNEFANLTGDIVAWGERKDALEAEGKGNAVNDIRGDLLDAYSKKFKISSDANGLSMETVIKNPKTGEDEVVKVPASKFSNLMKTDKAVDIETDLDDIVKLGGLTEKIKGWGRDAKKITDYTRGEEGKALIRTRVDQWSVSETVDYAIKRGLVNAEDVDPSVVFGDDVSPELKEKVINSMSQELSDRLTFKAKEEIYNDPYAAAAIKEANARKRSAKDKSKLVSGSVVKENLAGDKYNALEFYPKNGEGITFNHLLMEQDGLNNSNMGRKFYNSLSEGVNGIPFPIETIKDTTFKMESQNLAEGLLEIEMGFEFDEQAHSERVQRMTVEEMIAEVNSRKGLKPEDKQRLLDNIKNDEGQYRNFLIEKMKEKNNGIFKYVPKTLTDYNAIRAATGRDALPQEEWNKYQAALKEKRKVGSGGAMAKHNK